MSTATPVFDASLEATLPSKRMGKSVDVRFPSDEEWMRRHRRVKTKIVNGSTVVEGDLEAAKELLDAIQIGGDEVDEAEAALFVERLEKADTPDEPERIAEGLLIRMVVFPLSGDKPGKLTTLHVLRVPTEAELRKYKRSSFRLEMARRGRGQQIFTNPETIADFYDALRVRTEGYAADVPLPHKLAAVNELTDWLDAIEADDNDPLA